MSCCLLFPLLLSSARWSTVSRLLLGCPRIISSLLIQVASMVFVLPRGITICKNDHNTEDGGLVTLINVFSCEPQNQQHLIDAWIRATEDTLGKHHFS